MNCLGEEGAGIGDLGYRLVDGGRRLRRGRLGLRGGGGEGDRGGGSELGSGQRPAAAATVGVHGQGLPSTASTGGGGGVDNRGIVWERRMWGLGYRSGGDGGASGVARLGCGAAAERGMEAADASCGQGQVGVPVRAGRDGFVPMFVRTQ
jgi:hypothetical protein